MEKNEVQTSPLNTEDQLTALSSVLLARAGLMSRMGKSFGNQRDLFASLGYELYPTFASYWYRYKRTSLGKRIIEAYPSHCWKTPPHIQEDQSTEQTPFEQAWSELVERLKLFQVLRRLDVLTGIGSYGVLYFGFDDLDPTLPLQKGANLLYVRPFTSNAALISTYETDKRNPRYGLPLLYSIQLQSTGDLSGRGVMEQSAPTPSQQTQLVHYSRILHVAEDLIDNEIFGTPRLEACLNDLQSLDYVVGGSGEMFWRGAFPGTAFLARDGVSLPAGKAKDAMEDEITEYVHGLKRHMKLTGVDVHDFAVQNASPKDHYDVLVSNISSATKIPKRILGGSERGELASTQDRDNWNDAVADRQSNHCEPVMLKPLIEYCIEYGILPTPIQSYQIFWPPLATPNTTDSATAANSVANALNTYAAGPAETVIPMSIFLKRYLNFTAEEVEDVQEVLDEQKLEKLDLASDGLDENGNPIPIAPVIPTSETPQFPTSKSKENNV